MKSTLIIALVLCLSAVWALDFHTIAKRGPNTGLWTITREAEGKELVSFKILLKQQNLYKLEKIFWEVSNPKHENYGKFLSRDELKSLIAPNPAAFKSVVSWLRTSGIPSSDVSLFSDYIAVTTTVQQASDLFRTSFSVYKSSKTQHELIRIVGEAYIPASIKEHIHFVSGISELIDDSRIKASSRAAEDVPVDDQLITPAVLKSYYNIPNTAATNTTNLQGIAAFSDFFSEGAFQQFGTHFNLNTVNVSIQGEDCINQGCDQYESDLDVQYITSIGLGVPTVFIASNQYGQWVLDWAQDVSNSQNPPLVNSISYGWAEYDQCAVTIGCSTYGYDSEQYVNRTNTEFQLIGNRGVSIMVSAGDDGAPSLYEASGNCPIDASHYCPAGGCNHTTTACPSLTFTLLSNNTNCFFPMGVASESCAVVIPNEGLNAALQDWADANSQCEFAIEDDRMGLPHFYSSCTCEQLVSHSSNGINIAPYTFDQNNGAVFSADYPTSSPYVTSVAATQFLWSGTTVESEVVCSIETGAIITTGGGFSSFQPQPSYQANAVNAWIQAGDNLPPSFSYNPKFRAYPDIAFNGHNFFIFASNNSENLNQCPCAGLAVDGTSCSSPSFTGLVSLVNDQLLNAGKSQLGFLNPILYQMFADQPSAFNDITTGNNNCNRGYCCEYGFQATKGWDPASGLGSPDFTEFAQYALSQKGL